MPAATKLAKRLEKHVLFGEENACKSKDRNEFSFFLYKVNFYGIHVDTELLGFWFFFPPTFAVDTALKMRAKTSTSTVTTTWQTTNTQEI